MKQLNFRHFNTNRKKYTVTVNFGQKETKTAPKRPILFCLIYQDVFSHYPTIPDHLRRFSKNTEDPRRLPMISEDYRRFPRRNSKNFYNISSLYSQVKDVFLRFTMLNKNDRCHSFLVKSSWICAIPDRPDVHTNKGKNERGWHGQIC